MGKSDEIARRIKEMATTRATIFSATVKAVDEENMVCEVEPDGQAELDEVRLKAGIDGITDGIVEFPAVDSTVLCAIIGKDEDICTILKCSSVDKVVINGGELGGLTITSELKTQLDKTKEVIDSIVQILSGSPINEPGNGSPSALQAALGTALEGKELGDYSNIEDEKVLH